MFKETVLWIRLGFNADPDPAFYPMWIKIWIHNDPDPDLNQTLIKVTKIYFFT